MTKNNKVEFGPAHHALLFAWIAQEVIQHVGDTLGQPAVRKAVRKYGEQRGSRMAQRVIKDGLLLNMTSYMAYGEWRAEADEFNSTLEAQDGTPHSLVYRCPWHEAWKENGVNAAGRLYCMEIDTSLARGFQPELRLEVTGTRSNGAEACEFIYHQADLDELQQLQVDKTQTVMDWSYHLGHLYKTMTEVLTAELGQVGQISVQAAFAKFTARYGESAAELVESYQAVDFNQLPDSSLGETRDGT